MSFLDAILPDHEKTILDILKADHDKVKDILDKVDDVLESFPNVKENEELHLMQKLIKDLEPHAKAEELIFYKALREMAPDSLNSYEGVEEHLLALQVLKILQKTDMDIKERSAKIKVLKEMLLHHIKEEESRYFAEAKELFSNKDLVDMGKEFLKTKEKIKSQMK